MTNLLSVGEAAREIGANPLDVTAAFYADADLAALCPKVGHQRVIARKYLPTIAAALRRKGKVLRPRPVDQPEVEAQA